MRSDTTDTIPQFIAELVRAANDLSRVSTVGREGLLGRAALTIRDFRDALLDPAIRIEPGEDKISLRLRLAAASIPRWTDEQIGELLLEAAAELRRLRILTSAKENA